MSDALDGWLTRRREERLRAGLQRVVVPRGHDRHVLDFAGNDYLGLARDPRVIAASVAATQAWGSGSTGSRLVTGTTELHRDLEVSLAEFAAAESALVFSSGYTANLGLIATLGDAETLVVSDQANHASIIDACRLTRSRVVVTPHADVAAVARALDERAEPRALVVTDAVFSTDGALAPLVDLHRACRSHDAALIVDEAHSIGVVGAAGDGLVAAAGLAAERDVVRTVTLSKALGSQGGAVVGSEAIIDELRNSARTFVFDTGLAPGSAGAALAALEILRAEPTLALRVRGNAGLLAEAIGAPPPMAAVVSLVLGDPRLAVAVADRCRTDGVLVGCFRPPSVPAGTSRLRLTARADLTEAEIFAAAAVVVDAVKQLS